MPMVSRVLMYLGDPRIDILAGIDSRVIVYMGLARRLLGVGTDDGRSSLWD